MANRAYLFSSDFPREDWPDVVVADNRPYYDSRHTLPLAWLFFFQAANIRLAGDEIYFAADRKSACGYFLTKQSLVQDIAGIGADYLGEMYRHISEWSSGSFLLMHPGSVGDFYTENLSYVQRILETIARPDTNPELVKQAIQSFPAGGIATDFRFNASESARMNLTGCTYR